MSGHSKWSTIKRKKGAADAKRGKIFTRCIHEITIAAREGGGDAGANPRLRFAIDKAKSVNMPNENIERAIKRATGEIKGEEQFELTYEGYGPGGSAVLVEVVTDNKNRTASEVRYVFTKCAGSLGSNGCVSWMFEKKGLIVVEKSQISEDELMEMALDAGAEDVADGGDVWEVKSSPNDFHLVRSSLEAKLKLDSAELQMIPKNTVQLKGKEAEQMMRMLEMLEELDDVLNVASNCDFVDQESE